MPTILPKNNFFPGRVLPDAYNFEDNRLATYKNLCNCKVFVTQLAKAGLVYTGTGDKVSCCWCPFTYEDWQYGQRPMEVHKTDSPTCPLFTQTITRDIKPNISIPTSNYKHPAAEMQDYFQRKNIVFSGMQESGTDKHKDHHVHTVLGVAVRTFRNNVPYAALRNYLTLIDGSKFYTAKEQSVENVTYPEYTSEPLREKTFIGFPKKEEQLPSRLSRYGFFYTGHADIVLCYYCGLALYMWQRGDDPKIVHAGWEPNCGHLRPPLVSSAFIESVRRERTTIGHAQ